MVNVNLMARKIAKLYAASADGLKICKEELLKLCNLEYINVEMEFYLNKALNKLRLELMQFKDYYLVITLK